MQKPNKITLANRSASITTTTTVTAHDQIVPFRTNVKNAADHTLRSSAIASLPVPTQTPKESLNSLAQQHQSLAHKPQIVTPVKVSKLSQWLDGYHADTAQFLINGFEFGFKIPYYGSRCFKKTRNLQSALDNLPILRHKIQKEIEAGRVMGPFKDPPFPNCQVSPLGLVPKKNGDFRIIQHLSAPEGSSVNDGIPKEFCSVQYQNIDDAVALVKRFGKGCLLSKCDLENAFRMIPISPVDFELQAFCIDNLYYYDKTLTQGLSYSCALFETFSTSLHWMAETKLKIPGLAHVLDDFLLVGPPDYNACLSNLNKFLNMADTLGIPIKHEKTVLPCTTLTFVGIELDSVKMEKRLPLDKLVKIRGLLEEFKKRRKVKLVELQSPIGLLNFACSVVTPGRTFLRRLIDLTVGLKQPHHRRHLNCEARADLEAWATFSEHFNGKSMFLSDQWLTSSSLDLYTDSSNIGYGGYLGNKWFAGTWPEKWNKFHITIKELFPIVLAVELFSAQLQNKCIIFHTDNIAVSHVINKQTSKEPTIMKLVRRLVVQCLRFNILFKSQHLAGSMNYLSDYLSRQQIPEFLRVFPHPSPLRIPVPESSLILSMV